MTPTHYVGQRRSTRGGVPRATCVWLTGVLTVGAILIGSTPSARATMPGLNGVIAGSNLNNLVFVDPVRRTYRYVAQEAEDVAWAPSGDMLAIGSGTGSLRIVSTTGVTIRRIDDECFQSHPTWSPDGSQIAYQSCVGLSIVNADGSAPTPIPNTLGFSGAPEWSPDGAWIAMFSFDEPDIWKIEPDGENLTEVVDREGVQVNPTWSPDGTRIAFEDWSDPAGRDIYVVNSTGGAAVRLTNNPPTDEHPSWSPDGSRILFSSSRSGGGLFTMAVDGSDVRKVEVTPSLSLGFPVWQPAQVTLRTSRSVVDAGETVGLNIRISGQGTDVPTVAIQRRVKGGAWADWRTVEVDATGRASTTARQNEHTFYRAEWAGDADHVGGTSLEAQVKVRVVVTGHLFRWYAKSGRSHLYHLGDRIWYSSDIRPNLAGKKMCFEMERRRSGGWRDVFFDCYVIPRGGETIIYIYNVPLDLRGRVRAVYRSDPRHLGDRASWAYFHVTR